MSPSFDRALALVTQVPRPPEASEPSGATADQLNSLERSLQQPLPVELTAWLGKCNGVVAGPGVLYGARPDNLTLDIGVARASWPEWVARGWIPVASDGTGNAFVLQGASPPEPSPVYFVDCSEDPARLGYVAASSLDRFLVFLLERELGQGGWPFDSSYVLERDPEISEAGGAPLPWDA